MASVPFTQFVMPYGHEKQVFIERPDDIVGMSKAIIASGNRFECEILSTGDVSLTITNDRDGDLDIEVVPNGPDVPVAVDRMITRFSRAALSRASGEA